MSDLYFDLLQRSEQLCSNVDQKTKLANNIHNWEENHDKSLAQFSDVESAKEKTTAIIDKSLYTIDRIAFDFETGFKKNGGYVCFSMNNNDVCNTVLKIIKDKKAKNVVINSNNILDDIGIKASVGKKVDDVSELNIDNIAADIDYVKNTDQHPAFPAINCNSEDIIQQLSKNYGGDDSATIPLLISEIRADNDIKMKNADVFISGVNFLAADTGSVVVIDNEGAFQKAQLYAKTRIFIASINQIIANIADLETLVPMYSSYAYGQKLPVYCNIISGSNGLTFDGEPSETYVIITSSKRISLLNDNNMSTALRCINCGACMNVCPVYRCGTGTLYSSAFPGPIGLIFNPMTKSLDNYHFLPFLCTLCGKCSEACPVNIDFPSLIVQVRQTIVDKNYCSQNDKDFITGLQKHLSKRKKLDRKGIMSKDKKLKHLTGQLDDWLELPVFANKSFSEQYEILKEKERKEQEAQNKANNK